MAFIRDRKPEADEDKYNLYTISRHLDAKHYRKVADRPEDSPDLERYDALKGGFLVPEGHRLDFRENRFADRSQAGHAPRRKANRQNRKRRIRVRCPDQSRTVRRKSSGVLHAAK